MSINLMPWRQARRKQLQKDFNARLGLSALAAVAVVVVLAVVMSAKISTQNQRNAILNTAIAEAEKDIEEITALQERRAAMIARKEVIERLQASRDQLPHIFHEVASRVVDGAVLTSMSHKSEILTIEGDATSNNVVASFVRNLEQSAWFDKPEIVIIQATDEEKARNAGPAVMGYRFTVQTKLKNPNLPAAEEAATPAPAATGRKPKPKPKPEPEAKP